jgi:hypothetical protein
MLRRILATGAAVAALTVFAPTAADAAVSPPAGWDFQGGYPPGDIFSGDDQCSNAGQAMLAAGTAATWECLLINGQMNLYTLPGPWRYVATYPPNHSHFGDDPCVRTGQAMVAAGTARTWRCILRNGTDWNLEIL